MNNAPTLKVAGECIVDILTTIVRPHHLHHVASDVLKHIDHVSYDGLNVALELDRAHDRQTREII